QRCFHPKCNVNLKECLRQIEKKAKVFSYTKKKAHNQKDGRFVTRPVACISLTKEREKEMGDETKFVLTSSMQHRKARIMSPEIVEIEEDSRSSTTAGSRDVTSDVYVGVGKDDMDVLKWALDHAVSPGARVFLVHVFPPVTYIPTPVGRLSKSQLSPEQLRVYVNEENNRRRSQLQKYIRLCNDAKVPVDTMLIEGNSTAKSLLALISVLNITNLVIGTKRPPTSWRPIKKMGKGEFIKKNAPEYCEVTVVYNGKKVVDGEQITELDHSSMASNPQRSEVTRHSERNFFECVCFSGKSS
ncbi:Usp domain-containing protein, partial [Cephalotus follicularis]